MTTWRPSRPLPFFLPFGMVRCECGKVLLSRRRYNKHWDAEHMAAAARDPNHPQSSAQPRGTDSDA